MLCQQVLVLYRCYINDNIVSQSTCTVKCLWREERDLGLILTEQDEITKREKKELLLGAHCIYYCWEIQEI